METEHTCRVSLQNRLLRAWSPRETRWNPCTGSCFELETLALCSRRESLGSEDVRGDEYVDFDGGNVMA